MVYLAVFCVRKDLGFVGAAALAGTRIVIMRLGSQESDTAPIHVIVYIPVERVRVLLGLGAVMTRKVLLLVYAHSPLRRRSPHLVQLVQVVELLEMGIFVDGRAGSGFLEGGLAAKGRVRLNTFLKI